MRIIHNLDEMTETARGWLAGGAVGLVPTMGYLHEGHISLLQAAHQECEMSIASIFVNPLLFDQNEDFARYPRDLPHDLKVLSDAQVDVVFIPRVEDIFPPDFSTYVTPSGFVIMGMEGMGRPGNIRGIATVITKLFQLTRPDVAYFGQKDAQQVAVVRKLVGDLNIDVSLRILPTVRENDGLALGKRNYALTPAERQAASIIYRALLAGKALIEQGERRSLAVKKAMTDVITTEPLAKLTRVEICHADTFATLEEVVPRSMLVIAARIGTVQLIDNIVWTGNGHWLL